MHISVPQRLNVRVLTHNIRYAADPQAKGEAPWEERLPGLLKQLRYHTAYAPHTIICLQEVLDRQLKDILDGLNCDGQQWHSIGVARDDGKRAGEYVPILYKPAVWKLKHFDHFWLSDTLNQPSFGWDAGCKRVVTTGLFMHRESSLHVAAMCTHLDNSGSVARERGAELIVDAIKSYLDGSGSHDLGPLPVFLAGDMNSTEDDEAYKVFTKKGSPIRDARTRVNDNGLYGYSDTFTGFDGHGDQDGKRRLDYVFVTHQSSEAWDVQGYATLPNIFEDADGKYISDHRAVVVDLELTRG